MELNQGRRNPKTSVLETDSSNIDVELFCHIVFKAINLVIHTHLG
jgi:hypothetical protein